MKPKGAIHIKYKTVRLPFQLQYNQQDFIRQAEFVYIYKKDYNFSSHIQNEIRLYKKVGYTFHTRELQNNQLISVLRAPKKKGK